MDACYSGETQGRTFTRSSPRPVVSDNFLLRLSRREGRVVFSAGGANETCMELDKLEHGVFTYYLLEGLTGKAKSNEEGITTLNDAFNYASDHVPTETGQAQHPVKRGELESAFTMTRH